MIADDFKRDRLPLTTNQETYIKESWQSFLFRSNVLQVPFLPSKHPSFKKLCGYFSEPYLQGQMHVIFRQEHLSSFSLQTEIEGLFFVISRFDNEIHTFLSQNNKVVGVERWRWSTGQSGVKRMRQIKKENVYCRSITEWRRTHEVKMIKKDSDRDEDRDTRSSLCFLRLVCLSPESGEREKVITLY